jgi:hypothetical protein
MISSQTFLRFSSFQKSVSNITSEATSCIAIAAPTSSQNKTFAQDKTFARRASLPAPRAQIIREGMLLRYASLRAERPAVTVRIFFISSKAK